MTLNKQLLCVSLLLLSIPWAGCQYLQEMDTLLRNSENRALIASTEAIAASFSQDHSLLFPNKDDAATNSIESVYFNELTETPLIDGYGGEWQLIPADTVNKANATHKYTQYKTAIHRNQLLFFFDVIDDDIVYNNPSRSLVNDGDRIIIQTGLKDYIFTTSAPGYVTARYIKDDGRHNSTYRESRITAHWQNSETGYHLEVSLPAELAGGKISFKVIDQHSDKTIKSDQYRLHSSNSPPFYIYQPKALKQQLSVFQKPGQKLKIIDKQGRTLANSGDFSQSFSDNTHWLIKYLYRTILKTQPHHFSNYQQQSNNQQYSQRQEITQALQGKTTAQWYKDIQRSNHYIAAAASPIVMQTSQGQSIIATLVAEQSSEQLAALTDGAFNRLLSLSFLAILIVSLGLLGYASWLSWRIKRLSTAATEVISDDGKWLSSFPQSQAKDEIGELTRNYGQLINRIKDYTEYLQTLSRKLSHELRTPLAVIHSSLDNLSNQALDQQSEVYQLRAKQGALRLGGILTAMSEASRVEESIEQAELETVELSALLNSVTQAYQDIHTDCNIRFINETENNPSLLAAPELLVQMLDKLVDNAASFCPSNGNIDISLTENKHTTIISVANDGPLLPQKMQGQLFDNMVSLRDEGSSTTHLGLGLHIVNLIVKYHHAQVTAENRDDNSGVTFSIAFNK